MKAKFQELMPLLEAWAAKDSQHAHWGGFKLGALVALLISAMALFGFIGAGVIRFSAPGVPPVESRPGPPPAPLPQNSTGPMGLPGAPPPLPSGPVPPGPANP